MKAHNAVVGMEVQVKRDCRGNSDEFIKGGLVCTVSRIDDSHMAEYELRLKHPDIDDGFAWVNASDVRRYNKPTDAPEPVVEPTEPLTKGTKVRVKSTVVGEWWERLQEGDIYILQGDEDVATDGKSRRIEVSAVGGGSSWSTQPKYFDVLPDEVEPKPVRPNLSTLRVGDYIVANDTDPHLQEGVAYRVVQEGATFPMVALHHSENANWRIGYCVIDRNVAKILREVNDATPRMVKSGSESTCRSE